MRIVEETTQRLVIHERRNYAAGAVILILGVAGVFLNLNMIASGETSADYAPILFAITGFMIVAGLWGLGAAERRTIIFDRPAQRLVMEAHSLWRRKNSDYPLNDILRAVVIDKSDSESTSFELQLTLRGGRTMRLLQNNGSKQPRERLAVAINRFLHGAE
jgi:hypothetical protein